MSEDEISVSCNRGGVVFLDTHSSVNSLRSALVESGIADALTDEPLDFRLSNFAEKRCICRRECVWSGKLKPGSGQWLSVINRHPTRPSALCSCKSPKRTNRKKSGTNFKWRGTTIDGLHKTGKDEIQVSEQWNTFRREAPVPCHHGAICKDVG